MVRLAAHGLVALAIAPAAPAAHAAQGRVAQPWATVNVCDTAAHPNAVGVRASMPGAQRRRVRLHVRFRVQWHDRSDGLWHNLLSGGDSGFLALGRAPVGGARQTGQIFRYQPPAAGGTQVLRGRVDFQWRIGRTVVRRATALTQGGHHVAAGSDPKGHSVATCTLRAP
jgi:hypothetical protein